LRRSVVAGGAGILVLKSSASAFTYQASEKLNFAQVGAGGRGKELLATFASLATPVALCDVNESKATEMYRRFPDVPKFQDYREMLEKKGREIDGVVVATPDHTHAVITAAAIRAGKHVYTEKPLTRTVHESRVLRELAAEHTVATSMGNQGTASPQFRRAMELIRDGAIGQVKEIHVWNDSGGGGFEEVPKEEAKVPFYLNWDLWIGPAKMRAFHPRWMNWHQWRDFGTGQLGNWASHTANLAFMALGVDSLWKPGAVADPVLRVEAKVDEINRLSFPRWEVITWRIPARGAELPAVPLYWHNGGRAPGMRERLEALVGRGLDWGDKGEKKWADFAGCLIVGTEGMIHATGHNATFTMMPGEKFGDVKKDLPVKVERSQGHERDWLIACGGGKPAWANFEYASALNQFLQLGNVATQFEGPLEFDPIAGTIRNHPEATAALRSEYRAGWSL
jgi:predicted dehydrogenase